ncbi:pilus assembly protein PilS [Neisseria meningitidis]|uniref:Pilus assembly protein PilS n=1 Tax=Neisseria meningitidis TaxID=487 RepID=A0AB36RVW1_NEIME|nr:pilus assembly protein PilS [Neisseria meningitidis]ATL37177.1 pilus assembly protein PilS [Neisseria meningitidis]AUX05536.1 pilus assembly protein PilS [Neisseria meningitidis]PBJ88944.1 pilus assembly protein PilS [Neisseria meningitidis]PNL80615.1 pilus assembly protein PilS [Neisseria meningitidis]
MGIQFFEFQSFPINCLSIECLDSRLRGNDESIRTETCIPSFPRTYIPSFPRKWESRTQNLKKPFYPISFRTDRPRFPPARE